MAEFTLSVPDNIIGVPPLGENQAEPSVIEPSVIEPSVVEPAIVNDPVVETAIAQDAPQEQQGRRMTLEDDWRMGPPYVMDENKKRYAIENVKPEAATPVAPVEPTYETVRVGHGSFQIDSNASQEAKNKALKNYIENDIDFYEGIDRESGASWSAQKAVGDSLRQGDKLAALRGFYPDAEPFGEENFIFTNPDTGKITLFNPPGFQVKDIARYGRPASIVVGSTLAGVAAGGGALFTGPGAPVAVPIAATAGAVWGGAQTATFYDFVSEQLGGAVRTESVLARSGGALYEGLISGTGEAIGRVAVPAAMNVAARTFGGATEKSRIIYETLLRNNILPTAGTVTRGGGRLEAALDQAAASATRMKNQIDEVIDGAQRAAEVLAAKIGVARTQQGTGIKLQEAAKSAIERFSEQQSKLETELGEKIGDDALFSIDSVRAFYDELQGLAETMPRFSERAYGEVMSYLDDIMYDAAQNGGRIPYSSFRQIRSHFGNKMADMTEGVNRSMYKRIYASMTDDLKFGADVRGLGAMFEEAVGFTRAFKSEYSDFLNKMVDLDAPEKGYRFLINSGKDGGTFFKKLQEQFTDAEWRDVSATIIQKMGYKNFGNEADEAFSVATFLGNWGKISDEAKDTLFAGMKDGPELRAGLNDLIVGFEAIAQSGRLAGHSNSAAVAHSLNLMNALGGNFTKMLLGASAVTGTANVAVGATGAAVALVGGVVTPAVASRLITNPSFVKWLALGAKVRTGKEASAHIARLAAISQSNPEIAAEIDEYIFAIQNDIMPTPGVRSTP